MANVNSSLPTMSLDTIKPVSVYRNITKGCWSIRRGGLVVAHASHVTMPIERGIKFHVSESGRQKVLRERVKNVHAWVNGYVGRYILHCSHLETHHAFMNSTIFTPDEEMAGEENRISYNPYLQPWFFWTMDGEKVEETMGCDLYGRKLVFTTKGTMHRVPC